MRGFSFEQLAIILVVLLVLTIIIILFILQSQKIMSGAGKIADETKNKIGELGVDTCAGQGGTCEENCGEKGKVNIGKWGCEKECCV